MEGIHIYHSIYSWGTVEKIPRLGDVQVHVRLCTATGKLILNVNHCKAPINVQLMSFYQIHQRKSAISNLLTKISTYLSSPEVFHKPARVVTNTVWKIQDSKWRKISMAPAQGWHANSWSVPNFFLTADRLAQLVEHRTAVREVAGSNLGRTNTQGLKITEENVLPL